MRSNPLARTVTNRLAAAMLLAAVASVATAQMPGTIFGIIQDENGERIPGVTITVTDPETPSFKQVEKSDKRGRYKIFLRNSTVPYSFKFEKEGYQQFDMNGVKVPARQETRRNFTMKSQAAALADAQAGGAAAPEDAKGGPTDLYNQAVMSLNSGDLDTAERMFQEALEKKPDMSLVHAALARLYFKREDHAKAIEAANNAIAAEIDVAQMQQVLYTSHNALGNTAETQKALAAITAADPKAAGVNLFNQAADAYNNGDMAAAKTGLQQVLQADAEHAKANYMLGLVLIGEGDNAGAKMHLEKFLELAPNDPDAATAKEMISYLDN